MPSLSMQLRGLLVRMLEYVVIASVAILVLDVLWGVLNRGLATLGAYFEINVPLSSWTEEVAVNLLMWVSLLGAAVAYDRGEHLGLDYLVRKIDLRLQRTMAIIGHLVVVAFAASALVYGGYVLVSQTLQRGQVTPVLELKMGHVYLAVPVSGVFIVLFGLEQIVAIALGRREPFPVHDESATPASEDV